MIQDTRMAVPPTPGAQLKTAPTVLPGSIEDAADTPILTGTIFGRPCGPGPGRQHDDDDHTTRRRPRWKDFGRGEVVRCLLLSTRLIRGPTGLPPQPAYGVLCRANLEQKEECPETDDGPDNVGQIRAEIDGDRELASDITERANDRQRPRFPHALLAADEDKAGSTAAAAPGSPRCGRPSWRTAAEDRSVAFPMSPR